MLAAYHSTSWSCKVTTELLVGRSGERSQNVDLEARDASFSERDQLIIVAF